MNPNTGTAASLATVADADDINMVSCEGAQDPADIIVSITRRPYTGDEEVCGVCLEKPPDGCYVELWCCGNVLCVADSQQLGRCPFCRMEPLVWNIVK